MVNAILAIAPAGVLTTADGFQLCPTLVRITPQYHCDADRWSLPRHATGDPRASAVAALAEGNSRVARGRLVSNRHIATTITPHAIAAIHRALWLYDSLEFFVINQRMAAVIMARKVIDVLRPTCSLSASKIP